MKDGALLWLAQGWLRMGDHLLDITKWHNYSIQWGQREAIFGVDGEEVYRVAYPPSIPLGFVAWIDKQ